MNKFMRIVVFFDLPVITAKEKKAAAKFRKFLIKGSVRALTLTEKQFESIDILLGEKTFADSPESTELINIF